MICWNAINVALAVQSFSLLSEESSILADISILLSRLRNVSVHHSPRKGTGVAHSLAQFGLNSTVGGVWLHTTPFCVLQAVAEDLSSSDFQ
ncbi:hypothetical protein TorRG33x02_259370 [Trema orientale]|uniref:Uncharacterized protein n=1 Tax=Trema orientale TaxID=63057 RepID=A0A2P5D884_TREOI|nr:hypothetical protein TorRG33x02_259370 [Trema orientale]